MRKRIWLIILLACTVFTSLSANTSDDKHLKELIKKAGNAEKYPGANLVVIFDSTKAKVMDSGLSYVTIHQLTKVLKPAGAIELASCRFGYDPLTAYVEVKKVRIFRKDGSIEVIPMERVLDHTAPTYMIYWGAREKMVPVGRLEKGDALETVAFRKGFTYALLNALNSPDDAFASIPQNEQEDKRYIPPMRGQFYDIVHFWSSLPVLLKSYAVSLPSNKPIQYQVYNGELTSWVHFKGDRTIYHWEKKNIQPFKREPNMVALSDVAPKLLLSTCRDWIAKSLWFNKVNEDYGSFEVTPEIQKKVDELTKNCKTDEEKVYVLTHWVAEEIRYSGLSMGRGEGYTLHKGTMDFRDRCGVCKDKAGMLITILRAAGFKSYPAMTMAGSRIDRIPADQFNHCVVVWKKSKGNYVLLDPTWVSGVRELWSSAEQQQQYLMGVPEGADLKTTPISPPENHYFRVRGESKLTRNGTLKGWVTIKGEGQSDARIRRNLRGMKALRQEYFDRAMYAISPRAKIISLNYTDPYDISKPMKITIHYQIPGYATVLKNEIIFTPVVARHFLSDRRTNSYLHMNLDLKERKYAFRTRCSKLIDFKEKISLPKGYKISNLPHFKSLTGNAADFSAEYIVSKNYLAFDENLSMKKRIYPAEEWPNFRQAVKSVKNVSETPIVLTKK